MLTTPPDLISMRRGCDDGYFKVRLWLTLRDLLVEDQTQE
jgi:hypothetical protein